jgi:hypothetical protein
MRFLSSEVTTKLGPVLVVSFFLSIGVSAIGDYVGWHWLITVGGVMAAGCGLLQALNYRGVADSLHEEAFPMRSVKQLRVGGAAFAVAGCVWATLGFK